MALYVFEPSLLAHAEFVTPDSACTALGIAATYAFYRWLKQPTYGRSLIAALAFGLALLSKTTWLIFLVIWPLLWYAGRRLSVSRGSSRPFARESCQLLLILCGAIYITNVGYLFDGSFTRLDQFTFVSRSLSGRKVLGEPGNRFSESIVGNVPLPLPRQFILGIDAQTRDFEEFAPQSYLLGEWSDRGSRLYYLYCVLYKVPVVYLVVGGAVILLRFRVFRAKGSDHARGATALGEIVMLLPAALLFVIASLQTEVNHHFRYVLPAVGLCLIFAGQAVSQVESLFRRRVAGTLAGLAIAGMAASTTIAIIPHQLAYFNEIAGGPANGHRYLLGSNLDWGQDLLQLREHLIRTGTKAHVVTTDLSPSLDLLGISRFVTPLPEADFLAGRFPEDAVVIAPITTLCRLPSPGNDPLPINLARCNMSGQRISSSFSLYELRHQIPIARRLNIARHD